MEFSMNRFISHRPLVAIALALLGWVNPACATEQVPFYGVFAGSYTVSPIPNTPTATLVVSSAGSANPLGFFDLEIPHVVNFATRSATGSYRFIVSNGDKVDAIFTGESTPLDADGNYVLVVEYVTVTGGTGRFKNATGTITGVRLVDRVNLETVGYFDGTISKPRRR
jgi:hypothetical protein